MSFTEWQKGQQVLTGQQSHWFNFELSDQNGTVLVTAPYTTQYGDGAPPWTATLTTSEIGAGGQVLTSAVPIATYQTGFDFQTTDATLTNGETGIFWTVANGTYPASSAVDIDARAIDSNNNPLGAPVTLVSDVANLEQFRVGSLATGGATALIAYSTYDAASQTEQIHYAGFTSGGAPIAGETGTLDTFSSPGYDAFGFGTLAPATAKAPSFVYLRALANNGAPDIGYETVGTNGAATSALTGVPLTYSAGSTNKTLYDWVWTRLDPTAAAGNNLVVAALTGDTSGNGTAERNLEVRVLTAGKTAMIDDVIPLATSSTDLTITQLSAGNFVVGYTDAGTAYLREYNNTGDVVGGGSYALPQGVSAFKIAESGPSNLLVAYTINNATQLAYDIFNVSGGPIAYRADGGVTRSSLHLHQGDSLTVKAGGRALSTLVDGDAGAILVQAGGATRGSVLNGSFEEVFGGATATGTVVNSSAEQIVVTGATATGTVVDAGGQLSTAGVTRNAILNAGSYEFVWQAGQDYGATLNAGSSQWLNGAAQGTQVKGGDQLVENGGIARGAVIASGDQDVTVGGSAINTVVTGGTQYVENGGVATLTTVKSGTFDLIGASTVTGLVVGAGGLAELSGDGQFIAASGATGVILNGGSLVKQSGSGTSLVKAGITQSGTTAGHAEAASGTLEFGGALSGLLGVTGDSGASLMFDKAVGAGTTLTFNGSNVGAQLNDASDFHGSIAGLGSGDTLDLRSILYGAGHAPTYAYSGSASGGTLTVSDGIHNASLALIGAYAQSGFHLGSDGHGGSAFSYG